MEQIDRSYLSSEEKWFGEIERKIALWESVVKDSDLSDEIRNRFVKELEGVKDRSYYRYDSDSNGLRAHDVINRLLNVAYEFRESNNPKDEVMLLFSTLRDDILAFAEEKANTSYSSK